VSLPGCDAPVCFCDRNEPAPVLDTPPWAGMRRGRRERYAPGCRWVVTGCYRKDNGVPASENQPRIFLTVAQKWPDEDFLREILRGLYAKYPGATIIHTQANKAYGFAVDFADTLGFRVEDWKKSGDPRVLSPATARDIELHHCANLLLAFTIRGKQDAPTDYWKHQVKLAYPALVYLYQKTKREKLGKIVRFTNDPELRIRLGKGEVMATEVKPYEEPKKEAA
jgi:hypothetical protein